MVAPRPAAAPARAGELRERVDARAEQKAGRSSEVVTRAELDAMRGAFEMELSSLRTRLAAVEADPPSPTPQQREQTQSLLSRIGERLG